MLKIRMAFWLSVGFFALLWRKLRGASVARASWPFKLELHVFMALLVQRRFPRFDVDEMRQLVGDLPGDDNILRQANIDELEFAGCHAFRIRPAQPCGPRRVLHFHGGGYIVGTASGCREFLVSFAEGVGAEVVTVDYRLAPEHPFPAALQDAEAAYLHLLDEVRAEGGDAGDILVAGESAGGGLALALCLQLKRTGTPQPGAVFAYGPWVQLSSDRESYRRNRETDILAIEGIDYARELYLVDAPADEPLASPIFGDLQGVAPVFLLSGELEVFTDDHVELGRRLQQAGVRCRVDVEPDMPHTWLYLSHAISGTAAKSKALGGEVAAFWQASP